MSHDAPEELPRAPTQRRSSPLVPVVLALIALGGLGGGGAMVYRGWAATNRVPLTAEPKGVSVVPARATSFQATKRFVGTVEAWTEARVGPQLVSAYVDTVLVRPGSRVKKADVIATLDCRSPQSASHTIALQARAIEERQRAVAKEAGRLTALGEGFVSKNEIERKSAEARAEEANLGALRSQLAGRTLEVDDCVLRAPFDGEVGARFVDPGAFVKPGTFVVSIVDRSTVRVVVHVPEVDYRHISPGTVVAVTLLADGRKLALPISRVAPQADAATRTLQVEIDLGSGASAVPVGTSVLLELATSARKPATAIPITGARVRGDKATLFVLEGDVAKSNSLKVFGERGSTLYVDPSLADGALVVVEGRQLLRDGDRVVAKTLAPPPLPSDPQPSPPPSPALPSASASPPAASAVPPRASVAPSAKP